MLSIPLSVITTISPFSSTTAFSYSFPTHKFIKLWVTLLKGEKPFSIFKEPTFEIINSPVVSGFGKPGKFTFNTAII